MNNSIISSTQATACGALSIGVSWCEPTAVIAAGLTARASSGAVVAVGLADVAANGLFAAAF